MLSHANWLQKPCQLPFVIFCSRQMVKSQMVLSPSYSSKVFEWGVVFLHHMGSKVTFLSSCMGTQYAAKECPLRRWSVTFHVTMHIGRIYSSVGAFLTKQLLGFLMFGIDVALQVD